MSAIRVTPRQLNEWLIGNPPRPYKPRRPVVCADGFTMSVQAGAGLYCAPSEDEGPWITVEVGYPSHIEPLLWDYAESPGEWTDTIYPRVPVEVVAAVIEVHGGFDMQERARKG